MYGSLPDSIPIAVVTLLDEVSATESKLVNSVNNLGVMVYSKEPSDKKNVQEAISIEKELIEKVKLLEFVALGVWYLDLLSQVLPHF